MTKFAWMCATEAYQPEELLEHARLADPATFQFKYVPDAEALSQLQKALGTFRAFSKALSLEELPHTEQLAKEGVHR